MAWTTPGTAVAGTVLTSSFWNEQVRDNQNFLYGPPSVRVRRSTDLTSYSSAAAITWSGEVWDTDAMYTSGSDVTIKTAGLYFISFTGRAAGSATITRILASIRKGGSIINSLDAAVITSTAGLFMVSSTINLAVNDTITASVEFTGGSAYTINGGAAEDVNQTRLTVHWIGKV